MNNLHDNPNWNFKLLNRFRHRIIFLFCCFYIALSACQGVTEEKPFELPTPSPENTKVAILPEITRPTSVSTLTSTPKPATPTPATLQLPPTPTELLPTPTSTSTPSFMFTGQGFLIYTVIIDGEEQIYALQPGGTSHFITIGSFFYGQPLSPDQTKLIIDTNDYSNQPIDRSIEQVFMYDLVRQEKLSLNLLSYPSNIFWSKDSAFLIYITRPENALNQLVLYSITSGENQILAEEEIIFFTDGWAMDNQHIAYVAKVNGQFDLFSVNSETLEIQQLSNTPDIETIALWSPTALQLIVGTILDERSALESWPWGVETLYLVDITNNEWLYFTDRIRLSLSVSWSSDGQQIAFISNGALCRKDLKIENEVCLLTEPYRDFPVTFYTRPVWSSDMKWVAFRANNGTCRIVYFWEVETNQVVQGDLGCDISLTTPLSGIYWSSADFNFDQ